MKTEQVIVLGSTGSVGKQALEVATFHQIPVEAIGAYSNVALLEEQIRLFQPRYCAVVDEKAANDLKIRVADTNVTLFAGKEAMTEVISVAKSSMVLNAIMGKAGLHPTLAAIQAKKNIALANKETLITAGEIIMREAKENKVAILPVDSEHSAIFQCLNGENPKQVKKLILTASGGPFFGKTREELQGVSVTMALAHPTWKMGAKITIDSASLMNKGFEVIEAVHLFQVAPEQIEVVVHRESIIHSMVEYIDHAVLAQMSVPDMRLCIQYALAYPNRVASQIESLDWKKYKNLTFYPPDSDTFILLPLAITAIQQGGVLPAVLNAANECAVALFLKEKITFLEIFDVVKEVVLHYPNQLNPSLEEIERADEIARKKVWELVGREALSVSYQF